MVSKRLRFFVVFLLILFVVGLPSFLLAVEKPRVVILPLSLHGPDNLTYLKDGVRAMLGSRLSAAGAGVRVVAQDEVRRVMERLGSNASAEAVGNEVNADLVLSGSITSLGEGLSIDLKGVAPGSSDAAEGFFAAATDHSAVVTAVNDLADEISQKVYGGGPAATRHPTVASSAAEVSAQAKGAVTESENVNPDRSTHPDRLFAVGKNPATHTGISAQPIMPAATSPTMVSRSRDLEMEIQGFDRGDVFGDGTELSVVAEKDKVHIYLVAGGLLEKKATIESSFGYAKIVSVSVADINNNGRAEIYVSANSGNDALSSAYEWDGASFKPIFDRQRWYVKPMQVKESLLLLGQRGAFEQPYAEGVYVLSLEEGGLKRGERLTLPEDVNIYDFVMADFTGDGLSEVAAVDQDDNLTLYDHLGNNLWRGNGNYGYTVRYIGKASGAVSDGRMNYNVPSRLIAADLNEDGRDELIVMKNPEGLSAIIKTIGSYTGGSIEIKSWNGISLTNIWTTGQIGSYVAEYQLTRDAGTGGYHLQVVIISKKSGKFLNASRSTIADYALPGF